MVEAAATYQRTIFLKLKTPSNVAQKLRNNLDSDMICCLPSTGKITWNPRDSI